jgi:hypothetical protein
MVYGVRVSNYYGASDFEAVFSTEAAAFAYAQRRSGERHNNTGSVTRWELDKPGARTWLMIYEGGSQKHRNDRVMRPRRLAD